MQPLFTPISLLLNICDTLMCRELYGAHVEGVEGNTSWPAPLVKLSFLEA